MSKRAEVRTISLDRQGHGEQWSSLTALAAALGLSGVSELARWLAETYSAAPAETVKLLQAARDRAAGGDEWNTLAMLKYLLPPIGLSAVGDE